MPFGFRHRVSATGQQSAASNRRLSHGWQSNLASENLNLTSDSTTWYKEFETCFASNPFTAGGSGRRTAGDRQHIQDREEPRVHR
jgi:hypothetical protein